MNKNKKNVGIGLASIVVTNVLSFITTSYIINTLGSTEYGYVSLANNFISYFALITVALNSMAARFISVEFFRGKHTESSKYFSSVFLVNLLFALVLIPVSIFIVMNINSIINVPSKLLRDVQLLWFFVFVQFIISNTETVIISSVYIKGRVELQYIREILVGIIRFIVLISLFYFNDIKLYYVGCAYLVGTIFTTIIDVILWKRISPEIKLSIKYLDYHYVVELVKSGVWNVIEKVGHLLNTGLDLWITNIFIDPVAAGLISVSKLFETICQSVYTMIINSFTPNIFESYSKGDKIKTENDIFLSTTISYFFTSLPSLFLIVFGNEFIKILYPNENSQMISIVMSIRIISILVASLLENTNTVFVAHNKLKRKSIITVFSGLITNTILMILLSNLTKNVIVVALVPSIVYIIKAIYLNVIYASNMEGYSRTKQSKLICKCICSGILVTVVFYGMKYIYIFDGFMNMVIFGIVTVIVSGSIQYFLLIRNRGEQNE